ncbi:MAG: phosphotriesterase [Chloroflexota bacterium]
MHEHLFIDLAGPKNDADARLADPAVALEELQLFRAAGGRGIVDMTPIGLGRRPEWLRQLAERTGLNIVAATGLYYERFYPQWVADRSAEELAAALISEATAGIAGTGVRPGVIGEIGSSRGAISPLEAKVFRAAALAQQATGLSIATHCTFGTMAEEQLALLEEAGADPRAVIIGHQDLRPDIPSYLRLAARGAFIAFDTAGKEQYQTDDARARLVAALFDGGYGAQVLVSCDITRQSYLKFNGGWGYVHLLSGFCDSLRAAGLGDREIAQLLIDNPARALSNGAATA